VNEKEKKELLAKLKSLAPLEDKERDKRVAKARGDFNYFLETYLPHYISEDTGRSKFRSFLRYEYPKIESDRRINIILAYRGGGKTTTGNRARALWKICSRQCRYAIQISDAAVLANENLDAMRAEFEENERLINDFRIKQGWRWQDKKLIVLIDNAPVMIQSFGTGTRIRGKNFAGFRPDEIAIDDMLNDENVEQEAQREKSLKWLKKAVFKLPDRKKPYQISFYNTPLHPEDPIAKVAQMPGVATHKFPAVLKMPDNLQEWEELYRLARRDLCEAKRRFNQHSKELLKGFEVDDQDWLKYNRDNLPIAFDLMMDYFDDPEVFALELQVEAGIKRERFFRAQTYQALPDDCLFYLAADPALGKDPARKAGNKSSFFTIVILAKSKSTQKKYITDAYAARVTPDVAGEKILDWLKTKPIHKGVIEAIQFQSYFISQLKKQAGDRGVPFPISELRQAQDKLFRIETLVSEVNAGDIMVSDNLPLVRTAFAGYQGKRSEAITLDILDTIEMANRCATAYGTNFAAIAKATQHNLGAFGKYKRKY
jgi:predicted phage terminase large subunit-like protein